MRGALIVLLSLLLVGVGGQALSQTPAVAHPEPPVVQLPNREDAVRFAVIGDSGSGNERQYEVADTMTRLHGEFPFEFVLMLGDNLYGRDTQEGFRKRFEVPYARLLESGVKFYASLGNHDNRKQRNFELFNMGGETYYTFRRGNVQLLALNSNSMDEEQLKWVENTLSSSQADWLICFFHHPLYSTGARHGPSLKLRKLLEPLFQKYGVDVVFSGHEHFYERFTPRYGVHYFISGAAGKLRKGNARRSPDTVAIVDTDNSFMLVEVAADTLYFQAISRSGEVVDSGSFGHSPKP